MVRVAWRMLQQRPAGIIATFAALWFAVVVVTTCGAMLESGLRYHGNVHRYSAAPVLVATTGLTTTHGSGEDREVQSFPLAERGRLDPGLRLRLSEVPGVRAAVADVAVPTQVSTPRASAAVEVHPWSAAQLAPFRLRTGTPPSSAGELVLDQHVAERLGVRSGQSVRLALASGPQTFTVRGIAAPAGASPTAATVFVDDAEAGAVSGRATQVIGVLADPGVATHTLANAVAKALPARPDRPFGAYAKVYTGAGRGSAESTDVDNGREFVVALSGVFGGVTLFIAALVIAGTVGLSVKQRHRDIALLRAIAATPRQVRRMVVREAVAVGLLAAATGVWPGLWATDWLRNQFVSRGLVPDTFGTRLSWLPPLVAVAAALAIAVVAAFAASLRTSRVRPTQALAETVVERHRLGIIRSGLGLAALAGGIALCGVSASASGDSAAGISVATVATLVVSVALLGPVLIRTAAATTGLLLRRFGATGRLAAANTGTSARRLSAVLSSLVLAVALGGSLWFVQTSEVHIAGSQARSGLLADQVVAPGAGGVSPAVPAAIRRIPGVRAATGLVHGTMLAGAETNSYPAQGVDTAGLASTLDLDVTSGSIADLHGATVAVDKLTAQSRHLHVGDHFSGWFGDGAPARLRVVAVYNRGLGFAALTLPRDLLVAHTLSGLDDAVFVSTAGPEAAAAVRAELRRLAPDAALLPRAAYQAQLDKNLVENAWANQMITVVLLVYVVIGAVNTLVMYALGRRREFAVLRLSGTTRLQVLRMVRLEQVLLLGLALVVGAAIAAATLVPMVKGTTGTATPYIPLAGWIAVIGGIIALGGTATVVPIRSVLRMRPVEAIGIRE
jgi:putative ABC transport system permease protein